MGFLKDILRGAISDGISKGIRNAVGKATEKVLAPKAEAYANKMADSLDEATNQKGNEPATTEGTSSWETSMNRLSASAERYAAAMEANVQANEALLKEWEKKLPTYPAWSFGGKDFEIVENGTTSDGNPIYLLEVEDATEDGLALYVSLLKHEGFTSVYQGSDNLLVKQIGNTYSVFSKTEAFNAAPHMTLGFYTTKNKEEFQV